MDADAIVGALGLGGTPWGVGLVIGLAVLRLVASELSARVSDQTLGRSAGAINLLGGNYGKAANDPTVNR